MRIDRVRQSNFPIHHMSVNAHGVLRECRIARFSKSNFAASGRRAASLNCGIWAVRTALRVRRRDWAVFGDRDFGR
jgi:hypothetical protein